MKIGIITIHNSTNYGACLQTWGIYKFLVDEGYNCEVIDLHRPVHDDYKYSKKYVDYRGASNKTLCRKVKDAIKKYVIRPKMPNELLEKNNKFDTFNKQIKLSRPYRSIDELYQNPPQYDVYISGSDQLWNPSQPFCIEPYFLTFVRNDKAVKLSYASSIGLSELRENEASDFKRWLSDYAVISVREQEAKRLLMSIVDKPIEVVPDPTFLVGPNYWRSIAKKPNIKTPYILSFKLNRQEIIDYASEIGHQAGKHVIVLPSGEAHDNCTIYENQGLEEYLGWFAGADMVVTDSFHGTVFAILMGAKNVFSYIHPSNMRGSRIHTLLQTFGIENHLLKSDLSQRFEELETMSIDHSKIYAISINLMEKSRTFLRNALTHEH